MYIINLYDSLYCSSSCYCEINIKNPSIYIYIYILLYIHCLIIYPSVCCEVYSKNKYTSCKGYTKVINTLHCAISRLYRHTHIYIYHILHTFLYIYHIKRELFYFPPSSLFESKKNIFGELWKNRTERRQPAATARLSSSIASVCHRSPFPAPPSLPTCSEYKAFWIKNFQ